MQEMVLNWITGKLSELPPQQLNAKIQQGYDLVEGDLKPNAMSLRFAKRAFNLHVDADELVAHMIRTKPQHGLVLAANEAWVREQTRSVNAYLTSL